MAPMAPAPGAPKVSKGKATESSDRPRQLAAALKEKGDLEHRVAVVQQEKLDTEP